MEKLAKNYVNLLIPNPSIPETMDKDFLLHLMTVLEKYESCLETFIIFLEVLESGTYPFI